MRFLKKYIMEIAAFLDLELFLWSITRRYYNRPAERLWQTVLDGIITVSGIVLCFFVWRLTKKWRHRSAELLREISRKLLRQFSERMLRLLERWQHRRGRGAGDLLGGRTRIEYDLFGRYGRRKKQRRQPWKQLEDESARIRWLYADMIDGRLRRGAHIRPSETPDQIARHEDITEGESELIGMYTECRYDRPHTMPAGTAQRWRDNNT